MSTMTICFIAIVVAGIILAIIGTAKENDWLHTIGIIAAVVGGLVWAAYSLCMYLSNFQ